MPRRTFIIGGGLAGMTVARHLLKQGVPVVLIEKDGRLGGKAGAVTASDDRRWDHGYHVFPAWYVNTRALLRELGVDRHLIDAPEICELHNRGSSRDRSTRMVSYPTIGLRPLLSWQNAKNAYRNVFRSALTWHESLVSLYFLLDLACVSFQKRGFLDLVSVSGIFRSRFYRRESIADAHHHTVLQASSTPPYDLSAMTLQKVVQAWTWNPQPLLSFFDDDLQTRFIEPFEEELVSLARTLGLERDRWLLKGCEVRRVEVAGGRIVGLRTSPELPEPPNEDDVFVLATPPEVTLRFVDTQLYGAERAAPTDLDDGARIKPLSGLVNLVSVPMAALHVAFPRRLPHVPKWPTNLVKSRYGLSFIDISQHWPSLRDGGRTVLSVIASNSRELRAVSPTRQSEYLVRELFDYLRYDAAGTEVLTHDDWPQIETIDWQPHEDEPLFLNTTGSWTHRPVAQTAVSNLFVAGDYCQSEADLTTMESAISSGMTTAAVILARLHAEHPTRAGLAAPRFIELPPRALLLLVRALLWPLIATIGIGYWRQRRRDAARASRLARPAWLPAQPDDRGDGSRPGRSEAGDP